ncbi:hypothetical protein IMZ48_20905 [Candidatus Bathyarchaeota archaeon]|nr:hypothetical protein [Candidatus Bathyarchaeota archaeon]
MVLTGEATMNMYSKRVAIVQTGWKTQLVSLPHISPHFPPRLSPNPFRTPAIPSAKRILEANTVQVLGVVSVCIVGTCVVLLVIAKINGGEDK